MPDTLIRCENVGKKFCRDLKKSLWYGVTDSLADLVGRRHSTSVENHGLRSDEFWANRDINFELKRGECIGLVGRNGAGKTTLLKMLNGLVKPDSGQIEMRGSVGAMIALGAGFNPILTARENIYVNGSILGLSTRQVTDRLEEIIEFSELSEFVDSPVRTFSSGMQVRLGFAVAVILIQPDVLLLDEILAVGDAGFRSKCYNAIIERANNAAVILVSHAMPQIARLSSRVLVMRSGVAISNTENVASGIQDYFAQFPKDSHSRLLETSARIASLAFNGAAGAALGGTLVVSQRHNVMIQFEIELGQRVSQALCVLSFYDAEQKNVARTDCLIDALAVGRNQVQIAVPQFPLTPGNYDLQIVFSDASHPRRPLHLVKYDPFCRVTVEGGVADYTCTCPVLFDSTGITK